jgi:hypothetical protein
MKNLLEVSEIVDNAIIDEYLSKLDKTKQSHVLHWFARERNATTSCKINDDDALGQPHVLKLANRFESYVDIENKVLRLPNAGRSMSMSSPQVDTKTSASASASVDESNAESDSESNDTVSGIMV